MEQNNKTLLIAVLIILLALVAFNFNKISGRAVGDGSDAIISISPNIVTINDRTESGKFIEVLVDTGSAGLDKKVYLHKEDGSRVSGTEHTICNRDICESGVYSVRFFISQGIPSGNYFIRATRDNLRFTVDSNVFTVRHV